MKKLSGCLATVAAIALAPIGAVTTPALSSAAPLNCEPGQSYDPATNLCRPVGAEPEPLRCEFGQFFDPVANACRPVVP
jgi:hypothetical protein